MPQHAPMTKHKHTPLVSSLIISALALPLARCGEEESFEQICADLAATADQERNAALSDADRSCARDEDCSIAGSFLSCVDNCGFILAVSRDVKAELEAASRSVQRDRCGEFEERGCRHAGKCGPPDSIDVAVCRAGRCEVSVQPIE
jgi:hypothetical protein